MKASLLLLPLLIGAAFLSTNVSTAAGAGSIATAEPQCKSGFNKKSFNRSTDGSFKLTCKKPKFYCPKPPPGFLSKIDVKAKVVNKGNQQGVRFSYSCTQFRPAG